MDSIVKRLSEIETSADSIVEHAESQKEVLDREMAEKNTKEQVTKGFVCREDAAELVEIAVQLAKKRGLE